MLSAKKLPTPIQVSPRLGRTWLTIAAVWCLVFSTISPLAVFAQDNGNIAPNNIEIDSFANFSQGDTGAGLKNAGQAGGYKDWVADSLANPDIIVGTNGAVKTGHWNGVRIVDGTGTATNPEQDIYLSGGKVNDPNSWKIGPGSTGSSKYDATQMYLANNTQNMFFGMERAGNNGTTAFDFEFNQLAPDPTDPRNVPTPYIPNRSQGDVLISYELQGSGGASGSVFTYIFKYNGTTKLYEALCDDDPNTSTVANCGGGLYSALNGPATPAPPWGYVNTQGAWVTGTMNQRLFAETQVPLTFVNPDATGCGGSAFVQIRTRSSSALGSDAKDTTKVFEYVFGGPDAAATLTSGCGTSIHYDATASKNANGGGTGLSYNFKFQKGTVDPNGGPTTWADVPGGQFDDADGVGDYDPGAAGLYRAIITVTENGACMDTDTSNEVQVYTDVGGTASLSTTCEGGLSYTAQGTGGSGSYGYSWKFYKDGVEVPSLASTTRTGTLPATIADGFYTAEVTITDAIQGSCFVKRNPTGLNVRQPLQITAVKDAANTGFASPFGDANFTATVKLNTSNAGSDTLTYQWQRLSAGSYVDIASENASSLVRSMTNIFTDGTISTGTAFLLGGTTDSYKYRAGALTVRLHASRTVNALTCGADSNGVDVKTLKAIDP